jgi:antitoxin (DNA-binding transcriptional repressor) of toxin-antitoxin stability system
MKTATVRQLRNQYREVLGWVAAGEVVKISVRGKVVARLIPEKPNSKRVGWSKSPAVTRDRSAWPVLSAKQVKSLLNDSQGSY